MVGTKRTAEEVGETKTPRAAKVAKTGGRGSPKNSKGPGKGGKKGIKASLAPSAFKANALPLHVNITHTPPVITSDEATVPAASADPGAIGAATLVPSVFSTGSYGWKGSKRVTVEVPDPDGGESEKLQVMISINATVMGSKKAKESGKKEEESKEAAEDGTDGEEGNDAAEAAEEHVEE